MTVDTDGVHSFGSIYYPSTEDELDDYFVDPDEFADWLDVDEQPRRDVKDDGKCPVDAG